MKTCPVCGERFEDELRFCTFDGSPLSGGSKRKPEPFDQEASLGEQDFRRSGQGRNAWKAAFFVLLVLILLAAGGGTAYLLKTARKRPPEPVSTTSSPAPPEPRRDEVIAVREAAPRPVSLAELSRQELMERLPKNLTRRFHLGESGQGIPDDLRIISGDQGEYAVLVGSGRLEGSKRPPVERLLILKYEENEFKDATRQSLPASYGSGVVAGRGAQVRFDEGANSIVIREPASSSSIVHECAACDHAYQLVALEWKNGRYVESGRTWENDRYSVFYVLAEALEKRRVDARARRFIDRALDPAIAQGFPRNGKEGWIVEWRGDDDSEAAEYELSNGIERMLINLTKSNGEWKAVQIVK